MIRTIASILLLLASSAWAAESAPGKNEHNRPLATAPNDVGRIVLFPDAAEFFGEAIRINPDNACIAWWEKAADYVAWEIESPKAAEYEVWLEWAIADDLAGNAFVCDPVTNLVHRRVLSPERSSFTSSRAADGQVHTLLRDEIEEFVTTGRSLMPEGFENAIPPERMAHPLAFLARSTDERAGNREGSTAGAVHSP